MPYTDNVPEHVIDLTKPERTRWSSVIREEAEVASALADETFEEYDSFLNPLASPVFQSVFGATYAAIGGRYYGEIKSWAKALGVKPGLLALMNCSYEISHIWEEMTQFGCTAGAKKVPGEGMVHVRNMDWPVENIGRATRIFRFVKKDYEFITVGVLGMVGVLSAMVPGKFSVTLNWAPPLGYPVIAHNPAVLLREALEECDGDFCDFLRIIRSTPLATPAFYFICTTSSAFVVERLQNQSILRKCRRPGEPLAQANHFHDVFRQYNGAIKIDDGDGTVYAHSVEREELLRRALRSGKDVDDAIDALDRDPVCNDESYQQMLFCPESGEYRVWRWI